LLAQDDGRRQRAIATVELKGQEIFAIGEWNSIEFSEADVDSIIKSFDLLELAGHIPLKLGHEGPDARDDPETQFALGWVTKLYREGKKLLADFTVPEKVAAWIRDGMLRFVSVELLKDVKADTREIPWVLDAVALLGADQPAVGILKSLSLTMARSTALQCRERVAFSRDNPTTGGHTANMAEPNDDMKALLARLTAAERKADDAEKERDTVRLTAARAEQAEAKLSELQAQTRNEKIAAHRKTLMELFEAPIKAKTILPAVREQFKRVYKTETEAVLDVTVSDADVFIRANPNPDAPRVLNTLQNDPNDPAEKALFSARMAAATAASNPANRDKPRDQLMVEAIQVELRRNPDLAKGWQNAPGTIGSPSGGLA